MSIAETADGTVWVGMRDTGLFWCETAVDRRLACRTRR